MRKFFFSTIKTNYGLAEVQDNRIFKISKIINNKNTIHSKIKFFLDIAGLIEGSSVGKGLGNKFLNKIHKCNIILHLVRFFKNEKIIHILGKVNLINGIKVVNLELILYDFKKCKNYLNKMQKKIKI
ncbi:MAG: GTPase [Candidatus Makana argininalis]